MDERFDRIDRSIESLIQRFDRVDGSIEALNQRVDRVERAVDTLSRCVLDFRQEAANCFLTLESRLDILSSTVASLESRFPPLTKAILDFGSLSSRLEREQSRQKDTTNSLAARVEKLEETISRLVAPAG